MSSAFENDVEYLSIREAAARIGVHPNTIRNWITRGTIKHAPHRRQARYRIPASEVERLTFEPTWSRRGLDLLLARYPMFDLLRVDGQQDSGPWLLVELGQPSEGDAPAWAVWHFAIWKATGAVYLREHDGAVPDDPIFVPDGSPYRPGSGNGRG